MEENKINPQRVLLLGVITGKADKDATTEKTLAELGELAHTAGAEVIGILTQNRVAPESGTYFGQGKLIEAKEFCQNNEIDMIIVDDELTGSVLRNIEQITETDVIDRSMLILDIFAQRATSMEGKLQVEIAQTRYLMPRLIGLGKMLSRLGGGIGTRGPGETKLETDRRHLRRKLEHLQAQLKELDKRRGYQRTRRKKEGAVTAALVGYTNAGKSSILNYFTHADIFAQDMLFATLDPTIRALTLPDDSELLMVDTVGFIRKLPHHLVDAFKSTLQEAVNADIILHVIDASSAESNLHREVSEAILNQLGCGEIPKLKIYNKSDLLDQIPAPAADELYVSAKTGLNMDGLLEKIVKTLPPKMLRMQLVLPYENANLVNSLHQDGKVVSVDYAENGIAVIANVENKHVHKYNPYKA